VAEVELPAPQRDLVATVADARRPGVPLVAVIVSGRPLGIGVVAERCDVVIYGWYPGPEGGCAIAGLILGEREPTGRLPVSLPRSSGTLPVAYDERVEITRRYVDTEAGALFPFGAGLGYGRWRLGTPAVSRDEVTSATLAGLRVEVPVANDGPRAGVQVVQLYARLLEPGVVPRRAVLVAFARVHLEPGAATDVELAVERDALSGLGIGLDLPGGTGDDMRGVLELWCSITGPGRREDEVVRLRLA
jgi:beta-glucosidase